MPPENPSPPDQPQMFPPAPLGPSPSAPSAVGMPTAAAPAGPSHFSGPAIPPPSDSPSPIGLVAAGAGLILLCVSVLLPRVSVSYEDVDEFGYFGLSSLGNGQSFAIDTSSVVLSVALLFAVGLSAHRSPGLQWPARLGAVGLAALTAAFAYHPITVMRQFLQTYEDSSGDADYAADVVPEVTVEADSGLYLAVIAVALLAASAFFMRPQRRPQVYYQPPPPAPAAGAGTDPGITVTPG